MAQTNATHVQDLLSHPFLSSRAQDSTSITPNEFKLPSTCILSHADRAHRDAGTSDEGFSDTIDFPSPSYNGGFSRSSSRLSSPLRTSFLPSSNSSQNAPSSSDTNYSGHYQKHGTSQSSLNQCSHALGGHRHSSMQFLIAHGRSRPVPRADGGDTGMPNGHTEYAGSGDDTWGDALLGGLIKPPVIRQFLHNGNLYKEEEERGLSRFELFADLVFVAIIRIFGEVAADEATVSNALKFILMFWPPWSIWSDMRSYLNVSGTDDVIQRVYILISSLLLVGYTAQGASIDLERPPFGSDSGEYVVVPVLPQQLDRVFISAEGYEALYAATGFFLVAKGLRILMLLLYALALPRFRSAHLIQALFTLVPCLIFLRMFFVSEVVDAMEVFAIGVGLDIVGKFIVGVVVHMICTKENIHRVFIPALEIGHVIEKTTAFFVLISGEILMAVAYVAKDHAQIGPHAEYGRSCLGIIMAFLLCWVYFDADSCTIFVHAIRRHWFSSILWTQLHLPLCASLVIVASALHKLIIHNAVDQGLRWYFAIGMSVIMVCMGIMGFLHRSLDKPGTGLIPRWMRLSLRIMLGILFAASPLFDNHSSVLELGIYCGGLGGLVLVETVGKIGTVGNTVESKSDPIRPPKESLHSSCFHQDTINSVSIEYSSGQKSFRRGDLTACEKGKEDTGSVCMMKTVIVRRGQRTGLAAL